MNHIKSNKLDCYGATYLHLYIGLDVHKESWEVSIVTRCGEYKNFSQAPPVETLLHYLRRHFPGAVYDTVYEAGYCGFWIHHQLVKEQVNCIVVNPADVPTKNKERRSKRDRVGCRKLSRSLCNKELEGIYVPPRSKVGGSESDSDLPEHGSETGKGQQSKQGHASLL